MKEKQPGKSGRQQYEERAEAIAAHVAEQFGIWIYDVEYIKEGQEYYLNVYIDKDGGVTINDCEAVSRILSDELDKADFIRDPYTLIVSSPGLGRALTKDRHLSQSIGQDVEIHLYKPHPETGEKDLRGELVEFDAGQIVILADAPVPKKGKGKGKGKKKSQAAPETETPAQPMDALQVSGEEQDGPAVQEDGRIRMELERKTIASVRLAFDF
jgi:ribosome maturation factor RimP